MTASPDSTPTRTARLEVRLTNDERALIQRAAAETGVDVSAFVVGRTLVEAQRVLADRERVVLPVADVAWWNELMNRPAQTLPGLQELFTRTSPWDTNE
ncbi:unannotated protein [freshwater metagenome]|uniref:Unannotated protein n=1 Tax=freshwater metagenome TaxID=449393 RepID=A0A6J6HDM7_9ZZZZ